MTSINPRDHPNYFPEDMTPEMRAILPELKGLLTPKNPNEIIIRDNFSSEYAIYLALILNECKKENLPIGEECATQDEL